MLHDKIKTLFSEAVGSVGSVASNISCYVVNLDKDLTRTKKFQPKNW